MRFFAERLVRARWLAMPLAAYLVITLALPLANAGRITRDFVHHAGWVLAGCLAMIVIAIAGGLLVELARFGVRTAWNRVGPRNVGGGR
ncbi:MAG: hypothetical protein JWO36_4905 [Myxococcales bacterium]|nr:hypothetical protein [Myxococcales bacterium]